MVYDHVTWNALFYLMERTSFGEKWGRWMKASISTVRFSILVNGSLVGFFSVAQVAFVKGPLSPHLFLLVMEVLSMLLKRMEESGFLCGCQEGSHVQGGLNISHLLFANVTILFCDSSREQLLYICSQA